MPPARSRVDGSLLRPLAGVKRYGGGAEVARLTSGGIRLGVRLAEASWEVLVRGAARVSTLADALYPTTTLQRQVGLVLGFSVLNALAAQVAIPLPFTPVPLTLQTFAVLLTGLLLGGKLGALALVTYLVEGAAGLPVFAGGQAGSGAFTGVTVGYRLAFPVAAFLVGWLAERGWDRRPLSTALAMVLGNLVIYLGGVSWLALLLGPEQAITKGLLPFLPGDLLKLLLAVALLPTGWALVGRQPR
jgi:biotin transport system substrate-specific component